MVPEEIWTVILSRAEKGTRQGLQDVSREWNEGLDKMVELPYEILGIKALPCPIGGGKVWEVVCCIEGFVIMYSRELGQAHLVNLSEMSCVQITRDLCATTFSSNPQMVYLRGCLYVAVDSKALRKYDLGAKKWSVLVELPSDCRLERLLVFQDGIVGAFEHITSKAVTAMNLECRFLDLDSCEKGWRQPFTTSVVDSGIMPAMAVLHKVLLVKMEWFKDSGGNWLYFWNEDTASWEFLSGKLDGEPIKQLVVVKDNELHAYGCHGTVSKCQFDWNIENERFSGVKWVRVSGRVCNKPIKFLSNVPYKLGNMKFVRQTYPCSM